MLACRIKNNIQKNSISDIDTIANPHIDVGTNGKKLYSNKVKQDNEFPNYESAVSGVFMQVEKLSNALIGAQYWLSPSGIFRERVDKLHN